ncbi:cationic amino acid transporter 3 isoform X1 [Drosophila subobscura]|uniref:cationic amino acid transporter 3 isoform X1 n=1 Tax=Drosophila subobscura TaxID=7241 RepID=UPI00155ADE0D|nr:cationic amino acid transporter 3 isoform X1 [Drosophila subobscura]XP_034656072.1 cationic amino acid transporter 3 isoform X1 [Drosophila subobscura]XP_034656073.1 cationic amino acid transporter 3 isoform X1 [Drosophila subobscura]XP_034656074.1 cationic amino acid transporter 3 isoform X1 [Drosophila subobscura]
MVQQLSPWKVLTRRKHIQAEGSEGETKLNRVLGLWDLTALGVGSTLGAGVYVLAGQIAKDQAGPSVMISFAIAALASLLAGICYAEFGARVPKAGSAYVYSYVCIGELAAFVIGWNLILEYIIGTASVCRGISLYLDSLLNDTLKETFAEVAPMNVKFLGSYFDFFAFGLVVVFGVALAFGVETSTMANNCITCLNIFILGFVIIAGAIKADFTNWTVDPSTVSANATIGSGGYFPFGFEGTLQGAATCFFGFVGFDCIATTGEEVRNPRKNIPQSILLSLLIIFLCYFGVSTVLTLMLPYYLQDANAPLPYAFEYVGWPVAMWIVTVGGLIGLLASLFGALFPLPRVMYSMAQDGLLFRFLGKVSPRFQVPVTGSIVAALFTAVIAGLFDLAQLVSLLSIGTLLAYSVVAISIMLLRYMEYYEPNEIYPQIDSRASEITSLTSRADRLTCGSVCTQLFNVHRVPEPNTLSTRIVGMLTVLFSILALSLGLLIMHAYSSIISQKAWAISLLVVLVGLICLILLLICLQPREARSRLFRVPFVPVVPAISIFINLYLMLQLDSWTWVRFGVWMIVGIPIFLACRYLYDCKNPQNRNRKRNRFAYFTALKGPLTTVDNRLSKESIITQDTQLKSSSCNSLDRIQKLSEVGEDLIEVKNANGKIFHVEDTKSENSTVTLGGTESPSREEEQSVIAMLDDVLDAEDIEQQQLELDQQNHIFERHFSLDSEMYPSVIETVIVATVHSSSEDDEVSRQSLKLRKCRMFAQQMLDDMFNSVVFAEQLKAALESRGAAEPREKNDSNDILRDKPKLRRLESDTSLRSQASSIEYPMHSDKFKDRLSHIIMNASALKVITSMKRKGEPEPEHEETEAEVEPAVRPERPQLYQLKSETDVRRRMFKAINGLKIDHSEDGNVGKVFSYLYATHTYSAKQDPNSSSIVKPAGHIPRPPKFDPNLYKTIKSISLRKQRPSLSQQQVLDANNLEVAATLVSSTELEPELEPGQGQSPSLVPFKAKLEAILQRGPSHRTQQRPDPVRRSRPGLGLRQRGGTLNEAVVRSETRECEIYPAKSS